MFDDEINRIAQEVGSRAKAFKLVKHDKKLVRFFLPLARIANVMSAGLIHFDWVTAMIALMSVLFIFITLFFFKAICIIDAVVDAAIFGEQILANQAFKRGVELARCPR